MSKYGRNPPNDGTKSIPIGKLLIVMVVAMALYVAFVLLTAGDTANVMCIEIMTLMLDDPEHLRLHEDYPNLFMDLHDYLDKNCKGVDLPDRPVSIGSEMEMP